jgi:hypothetical protein
MRFREKNNRLVTLNLGISQAGKGGLPPLRLLCVGTERAGASHPSLPVTNLCLVAVFKLIFLQRTWQQRLRGQFAGIRQG